MVCKICPKIRTLFSWEKAPYTVDDKQKLHRATGKTLPAWGSSHCIIFPITSMQILLWQKCISVFVRMCHFQTTADPTGPWDPGEHELRGLIHTSWQSHSNPNNTEDYEELLSCSRTSVLEKTSIEPPSPYVYAYVCMHAYIYKNS